MGLERIRLDSYLREFVDFCKKEFKSNLSAILIYGSYIKGYFNKRKSDYDIVVIFNKKIPSPNYEKKIKKLFPRITLQYFSDKKEILNKIPEGHWSLYIVLLKGSKVLYKNEKFWEFFNKLKKIDFWRDLKNLERIKFKDKFDNEDLKKTKGYDAIKIAHSSIRKRLQMLTRLKTKKLVFDITKNLNFNKQYLKRDEIIFLKNLNQKLLERSTIFTINDKNKAMFILNKLIKILDKLYKPNSF